jgi:flagellar biosynthesis regulator FlbT
MQVFTFAPHEFANDFKENGFVHIRNGISAEFLEFAREQLGRCRHLGYNEIPAREIKSKKKQYLFDLPKDDASLSDLFTPLAQLTGSSAPAMTLSERHIMIYDENAAALPPLHKDRLASEVSVGIPLEPSASDRIVLLPWYARELNLLDSAVYCERAPNSALESVEGWNLEDGDCPQLPRIERNPLVELDAKPGDVVVFRGSTIFHGRLHAANSSILYFKFNTMGLDPLGEDPSTEMRRKKTLEILPNKSDDELLNSLVELSPRLQHIDRQYSRLGWRCVLRVSVSGEKEFTISDDDLRFMFAVQGPERVRDVLTGLGANNDQLLSHVPRIRRLGSLGGIDFLN